MMAIIDVSARVKAVESAIFACMRFAFYSFAVDYIAIF